MSATFRRPRAAVLLSTVAALALRAVPAPALEWSMPVAAPPGGVAESSVRAFAAQVAADTGGGLTLAVTQAADAARVPGALGGGRAAAGAFPLAALEAAEPVLAMDRVPYLASNYVDAAKLWKVLRPAVERKLAARGLLLLYAVPGPPPAPLSLRPMLTLEAWRGMRLLADEPGLDALAPVVGLQAVRAPGAREAFAGGNADAAFRAADAAAGDRAWEYAAHYLDARAWFPKTLVVAARSAFDGLAPAARDALRAAAAAAEQAAWQASERAADAGVQRLRDYGIKAVTPPVKLLIRLEAVGRELLFRWSESAGEEGAQIVERYYEIR